MGALRRLPGIEVAVLVGRTTERASEAASRLGVPRALASVDELLLDEEIRAVHNCTPNDLHAEVNAAVLSAGRHVLSEKPLGRSGQEALAARAAESDAVAGVCFNYRHYPLVRELRSRVASGLYGRVHLVHGRYLQDWLLFDSDWSWRLDPDRNGPSRAVADIGSHWMDLVQFATGERIVAVCADFGTLHEVRRRPLAETATFERPAEGDAEPFPVGSEDHASVLFRLEGGAHGSFVVSQVSAGRKNSLQVELDAAEAAFGWDQEAPEQLWIGRRDQANEVLCRDPGLLAADNAGVTRLPAGHPEGWGDALLNLVAEFYEAVDAHEAGREHVRHFAGFEEGAQVCELVDAVLASSRGRRWTQVGEVAGVDA